MVKVDFRFQTRLYRDFIVCIVQATQLIAKGNNQMQHQISETQLDNAVHTLVSYLKSVGIKLDSGEMSDLNDNLTEFLNEECRAKVVTDQESIDSPKVSVTKFRNVSCNANEEITYEVDKNTWEKALRENDGDTEHALLQVQTENKVVRTDYDAEIQEISAEFDVNVEAI